MAASFDVYAALNQAHQLFLNEQYRAATLRYREVRSHALPAAADVWLDASAGLGECGRLSWDYTSAVDLHRQVLGQRRLARRASGPLREANRVSVLRSYLGLSYIAYMSLRSDARAIDELIDAAWDWAAEIFDAGRARDFMLPVCLSIARGRLPSQAGALRLQRLAPELRQSSDDRTGNMTPTLVALLAIESDLDAGRLQDEPKFDFQNGYWASRWMRDKSMVLRCRYLLEVGRVDESRALLDAWRVDDDQSPYPDIKLTSSMLRCRMTGIERSRARADCRDLVHTRMQGWQTTLCNLADPLYVLLHLIGFVLDDTELSARERDDELQQDVEVIRHVLQDRRVASALSSRGFSDTQRGLVFTVGLNLSTSEDNTAFRLTLRELMEVVRP